MEEYVQMFIEDHFPNQTLPIGIDSVIREIIKTAYLDG